MYKETVLLPIHLEAHAQVQHEFEMCESARAKPTTFQVLPASFQLCNWYALCSSTGKESGKSRDFRTIERRIQRSLEFS